MKIRLIIVLGSMAVALLVTSIAGEVAVRFREARRDTVPGSMEAIYYRHRWLGHALIRNQDYFDWVHVNSDGFRGSEIRPDPPANTLRIMAIGGSTTFDTGVSGDAQAWPARLEAELNSRAAAGVSFEVVNAGVAGYTMLQHVVRLQTELLDLKPDLVILYATHNDLFGALAQGVAVASPPSVDRPDEVPAVLPWTAWLERNSLFYSKVVGRLGAWGFSRMGSAAEGGPDADAVDRALEAGQARLARRARAVLSTLEAEGIPTLVPRVVHVSGSNAGPLPTNEFAAWKNAVPYAEPASVLRGYRGFGDTLRVIAEAEGARFVESDGFGIFGSEFYADRDPIHFNDSGAAALARSLAPVVLELVRCVEEGSAQHPPLCEFR